MVDGPGPSTAVPRMARIMRHGDHNGVPYPRYPGASMERGRNRLMRTWLFVPGHDTRKVDKALRSAADVVILDWEDAVPEERKQEARLATAAALRHLPAGPRPVVRVNNRRH